jgi:hypothetical protein
LKIQKKSKKHFHEECGKNPLNVKINLPKEKVTSCKYGARLELILPQEDFFNASHGRIDRQQNLL